MLGRHRSSNVIDSISTETTALPKQQLKQSPLKMPATDAGEMPGICNLRPQSTRHHIHIYHFTM